MAGVDLNAVRAARREQAAADGDEPFVVTFGDVVVEVAEVPVAVPLLRATAGPTPAAGVLVGRDQLASLIAAGVTVADLDAMIDAVLAWADGNDDDGDDGDSSGEADASN